MGHSHWESKYCTLSLEPHTNDKLNTVYIINLKHISILISNKMHPQRYLDIKLQGSVEHLKCFISEGNLAIFKEQIKHDV